MKAHLLVLFLFSALSPAALPRAHAADDATVTNLLPHSDELLKIADAKGGNLRANFEMEARAKYLSEVKAAINQVPPATPPDPKAFFAKAENYFTFSSSTTNRIEMRQELLKGLDPYWKNKTKFSKNLKFPELLDEKTTAFLATEYPEQLADIHFALDRSKDFYKAVQKALPERMKTMLQKEPARAKEILTALISKQPGNSNMINLYLDIQRASKDAEVLAYLKGSLAKASGATRRELEVAIQSRPSWAAQIADGPAASAATSAAAATAPAGSTPAGTAALGKTWTRDEYVNLVVNSGTAEHELLRQRNFLEHLMLNQKPGAPKFPLENASDYFNAAAKDFPYATRAAGPEARTAQAAELSSYMENRISVRKLRRKVSAMLADEDVIKALMSTQPEEAWRFKALMPKNIIWQTKYYDYLRDGLSLKIKAALDSKSATKLAEIDDILRKIAMKDKSVQLAEVFIKLQTVRDKAEIIGHLNVRMTELDDVAQKRVRRFIVENPQFASQRPLKLKPAPAAVAAVDTTTVPAATAVDPATATAPVAPPIAAAAAPPAEAAVAAELPSPLKYQPSRGLGSARDCLVNSFRSFVR